MAEEEVSISTGDGECPAYVYTPEGQGPWPAVIMFMDGMGMRPVVRRMAQRMADGGHVVLLPDIFYRAGRYEPIDAMKAFEARRVWKTVNFLWAAADNGTSLADTPFFIDYIDGRPDVAGSAIGTVGYCMGGTMALTVAGGFPDRIAAAATFHAGYLASGLPDSPHLLASAMKARIYVAGADKDTHYPPEMAALLEKTLTDAGVEHRCEIYDGALHGWTMPDFPVYDEAADERHWTELFALFDATIGRQRVSA